MNFTKRILKAALLGLGVTFMSFCNAESDSPPKQYEIELLLFRNLVQNDGGEAWPIDYSAWFDELEEEDVGLDPDLQANPESNDETGGTQWLPRNALRLRAHWQTMKNSARYRPLAHVAWRQVVVDRQRAEAITLPSTLSAEAEPEPYIDGTVRVAVERYLHLYLDLQLHSYSGVDEFELLEYENPEFRLREHRRMRSKELHFFDHPRFGVLALITPYEAPPEELPVTVNGDSDPEEKPPAASTLPAGQ